MKEIEAKELVNNSSVAPDDLIIGTRHYELASTQLNKKDAQADSEMEYDPMTLRNGIIFKYQNGYAVYRRKLE